MPSFGDSIFIFILALVLFGPERLPKLARELGKLMAEFRRASNEFKFQIEEELRMAEQNEQQKKQDVLEAAQPGEAVAPIATSGELSILPPDTGLPVHATYQAALDAENGIISQPSALSSILAPQEHTTPLPVEDAVEKMESAEAAHLETPHSEAPLKEAQASAVLPKQEHEEVNSTHG